MEIERSLREVVNSKAPRLYPSGLLFLSVLFLALGFPVGHAMADSNNQSQFADLPFEFPPPLPLNEPPSPPPGLLSAPNPSPPPRPQNLTRPRDPALEALEDNLTRFREDRSKFNEKARPFGDTVVRLKGLAKNLSKATSDQEAAQLKDEILTEYPNYQPRRQAYLEKAAAHRPSIESMIIVFENAAARNITDPVSAGEWKKLLKNHDARTSLVAARTNHLGDELTDLKGALESDNRSAILKEAEDFVQGVEDLSNASNQIGTLYFSTWFEPHIVQPWEWSPLWVYLLHDDSWFDSGHYYDVDVYVDSNWRGYVILYNGDDDQRIWDYKRAGSQGYHSAEVRLYWEHYSNWELQSSGNVYRTLYFYVDATPPSAYITGPAFETWQRSDFWVDARASDDIGLVKCYYSIYDSLRGGFVVEWVPISCIGTSLSFSFKVFVGSETWRHCRGQGWYQCYVIVNAEDYAGNTAGWSGGWYHIDYTSPSTQITSPSTQQWQQGSFTPGVSETDNVGLNRCFYAIYDTGRGYTVSPWATRSCGSFPSISVGSNGLCSTQGSGACIVLEYVEDNAGNIASDVKSYSIDYDPPTSTITSPNPGSTQTGDFGVYVSDSDAGSGVNPNRCEYRIFSGGTQTRGFSSRTCNSYFWVTVGPSGDCRHHGTNTCEVRVRAEDNLGKVGTETSRSFSASINRPPSLSSGSVSPTTGSITTSFTYSVTYSDPDGDAPTVARVYIDGSPRTMSFASGSYTGGALFQYQTTLSAGSHNFYFYFEDSKGGTASTGTLSGPTVKAPPSTPTPLFPFDGKYAGQDPELKSSTVSGVTDYWAGVDKNKNGKLESDEITKGTASSVENVVYYKFSGLFLSPLGTSYDWYVYACNDGSCSGLSTKRTFTVVGYEFSVGVEINDGAWSKIAAKRGGDVGVYQDVYNLFESSNIDGKGIKGVNPFFAENSIPAAYQVISVRKVSNLPGYEQYINSPSSCSLHEGQLTYYHIYLLVNDLGWNGYHGWSNEKNTCPRIGFTYNENDESTLWQLYGVRSVIHELGHFKGVQDFYRMDIGEKKEDNAVVQEGHWSSMSEQGGYKNAKFQIADEIMQFAYDPENDFSVYSISLITNNKGYDSIKKVPKGDLEAHTCVEFPEKTYFKVTDPSGNPVQDAKIKVYTNFFNGKKSIIDSSPEIEADTGPDGRILFANKPAGQIVDYLGCFDVALVGIKPPNKVTSTYTWIEAIELHKRHWNLLPPFDIEYETNTIRQGQVIPQTLDVVPGTQNLEFVLDWAGSDLNLHIYDPSGRHVGLNYETQSVEVQVDGATYSGPNTKPESINVENPIPGRWTIKVIGIQVTGKTEYSLDARYALINASPMEIERTVKEGKTLSDTITISNSGTIPATGVQLNAEGVAGRFIKFERDVIGDVRPGQSILAKYSISVPDGHPPGVYSGELKVLSENSGTISVPLVIDVPISYEIETVMEPVSTDITPGDTVNLLLQVRNAGNVYDTYSLALVGPSWASLNKSQLTLNPQALETVAIYLVPPRTCTLAPGQHPIQINVRSLLAPVESSNASIANVLAFHDVTTQLLPPQRTTKPTQNVTYTLRVENKGNAYDTFRLNSSGIDASWLVLPTEVTLPACATSEPVIIVTPAFCTEPTTVEFQIKTRSALESSANSSASANLIVDPILVAARVHETATGVYNATSLVSSTATGDALVDNREIFNLPYVDVSFDNASATTLEAANVRVTDITPGENLAVSYAIIKSPRLAASFAYNTSFGTSVRFSVNETIDFRATLRNTASDSLSDVNVTFGLPSELSRLGVQGVEVLTPGLSFDAATGTFSFIQPFDPLETKELAYRVFVRAMDPDLFINRSLAFNFTLNAAYTAASTLSGLAIRDVNGCVVLEGVAYRSNENIALRAPVSIDILSKIVLAFTTDGDNERFVDALAAAKPDTLFTQAHTKADFLAKLRAPGSFFNVLWLANTDFFEKFTDAETAELKAYIKAGSPIGRGLMVSGHGFKYAPELGEVLGDKMIGSFPNGQRFFPRTVAIVEEHNVTAGMVGQVIDSTGTFVRAKPERSRTLAFLTTDYPGKGLGRPNYIQDLAAITVSIFGNGSGVFFAPDTGRTHAEGLNPAEWLNLTSNAIDWMLTAQRTETHLEFVGEVSPRVIHARINDHGQQTKNAQMRAEVRNVGSTDLFQVNVTTVLPEGFQLREGDLNQSLGRLEAGNTTILRYSLSVPASEAADYAILTVVQARDGSGLPITINGAINLSVELEPHLECAKKEHGKAGENGKGKAAVCKEVRNKPSVVDPKSSKCPPGWLKHGDGVTCEPPGQGGNGKGQGQGGGQGGGG